MHGEIIPGRKIRGFDGVLYNLWPLLTPWAAASRYQGCWPRRRGWSWNAWPATGWCSTQHQSGLSQTVGHIWRGALQIGLPDKLLTSYISFLHTTLHAYTSTMPVPIHLPILLLSLYHEVSALRSRVGWTSCACRNVRTNVCCNYQPLIVVHVVKLVCVVCLCVRMINSEKNNIWPRHLVWCIILILSGSSL